MIPASHLAAELDDYRIGLIIIDRHDEVWKRLPDLDSVGHGLWLNMQGFRVSSMVIAGRQPIHVLWNPHPDMTDERRALINEVSIRLSGIPAGWPIRVTIENWFPIEDSRPLEPWGHHVDILTEDDMKDGR